MHLALLCGLYLRSFMINAPGKAPQGSAVTLNAVVLGQLMLMLP
jgi:hypothetical protein